MKPLRGANFLREWRKHRGMTLQEVADAVGATPNMISKLEGGSRGLSEKWLRPIAATLGANPGDLLDRHPGEQSHSTELERTPLIRVTAMPADTNPYGGVFGGWLMGQMGLACGSFASRHSGGKAVVVAGDNFTFTGAMAVGDELSVYVELVRQGRTSMTLAAHAVARQRDGAKEFEVATGEFTFVALDENDRPRVISAEKGAA